MNELIKALLLNGDKYSPRIATFAKRNKHISKVYSLPWNNIDGYNENAKQSLYFSYKQDNHRFSAVSVASVRCGNYKIYCYIGNCEFMKAVDKKTDVTEWFIKHYSQFGKCVFGDDLHHNFVQINKNSRRCKHCNKIEFRTFKNRTVHERKEIWSAA